VYSFSLAKSAEDKEEKVFCSCQRTSTIVIEGHEKYSERPRMPKHQVNNEQHNCSLYVCFVSHYDFYGWFVIFFYL
jgi:hypothetical protein